MKKISVEGTAINQEFDTIVPCKIDFESRTLYILKIKGRTPVILSGEERGEHIYQECFLHVKHISIKIPFSDKPGLHWYAIPNKTSNGWKLSPDFEQQCRTLQNKAYSYKKHN